MLDEIMDPCECLSHEVAMRRLLSLLRQTQSYCTDTECMDEIPGQDASQNFMITALMVFFAVIIFMLRPRSSSRDPESQKISANNQGPLPPPDAPMN